MTEDLFFAYDPYCSICAIKRGGLPSSTGLWPQGNSRVADLFLGAPLRRTFAQQLPRRCASGLLASQVRRRQPVSRFSSPHSSKVCALA